MRLGVAQLEKLGEVEVRLLVVQYGLKSGGQTVLGLGVALSEGLKRLQLDLLRSGSRRELEDVKAAFSQLVNSHTSCANGWLNRKSCNNEKFGRGEFRVGGGVLGWWESAKTQKGT